VEEFCEYISTPWSHGIDAIHDCINTTYCIAIGVCYRVGLQGYFSLDEEHIWMCARIGVGDITTACFSFLLLGGRNMILRTFVYTSTA
jgi:hypothetical protein